MVGGVDPGSKSHIEGCRRLDQGRVLRPGCCLRLYRPYVGLGLLDRFVRLHEPRLSCKVFIWELCRVPAVTERPPTADHGVIAIVLAHAVEIVEVGNDVLAGFLTASDDHAPTGKSVIVEATGLVSMHLRGCNENYRHDGNNEQYFHISQAIHSISPPDRPRSAR